MHRAEERRQQPTQKSSVVKSRLFRAHRRRSGCAAGARRAARAQGDAKQSASRHGLLPVLFEREQQHHRLFLSTVRSARTSSQMR